MLDTLIAWSLRSRIVVLALASLALVTNVAQAQKLKIAPDQLYLLLATTKTSTMQEELDEAAKAGFRILVGSPTSGDEMVILMQRVATPPDTYAYQLLATTKTGTMQKELTEAAAQGFRLLPRTMIAKKQAFFNNVEVVALLERPPQVTKRYEYRLLATNLTSTLQEEITEALAEGFVLAGLVSRGEHMVIMEKETNRLE